MIKLILTGFPFGDNVVTPVFVVIAQYLPDPANVLLNNRPHQRDEGGAYLLRLVTGECVQRPNAFFRLVVHPKVGESGKIHIYHLLVIAESDSEKQ